MTDTIDDRVADLFATHAAAFAAMVDAETTSAWVEEQTARVTVADFDALAGG